MRPTAAPRREALRVWVIGLALIAGSMGGFPRAEAARPAGDKSRQVTVCGIIATAGGDSVDPKLAKIQPQLTKLLPGYSFKLLDVQSKQLRPGQSVACDLKGGGYTANAILVKPLDENGKVQIGAQLLLNNVVQLETMVTTPPNQLFFCDQALSHGSHLLIAVGAR